MIWTARAAISSVSRYLNAEEKKKIPRPPTRNKHWSLNSICSQTLPNNGFVSFWKDEIQTWKKTCFKSARSSDTWQGRVRRKIGLLRGRWRGSTRDDFRDAITTFNKCSRALERPCAACKVFRLMLNWCQEHGILHREQWCSWSAGVSRRLTCDSKEWTARGGYFRKVNGFTFSVVHNK